MNIVEEKWKGLSDEEKIEEAIKFVRGCETGIDKILKGGEVIKLLKRLDKFESMWKEFKKEYGNETYRYVIGYPDKTYLEIMESHEQKYFPKGA